MLGLYRKDVGSGYILFSNINWLCLKKIRGKISNKTTCVRALQNNC
jgi:hypothetical protein